MLTLETLTEEQKEFLQECNEKEYNKELDFRIKKMKHKFVEYGFSLNTIQFEHAGVLYKCAFVYEDGPNRFDWIGHNAAGEDCYLKVILPDIVTYKHIENLTEQQKSHYESLLQQAKQKNQFLQKEIQNLRDEQKEEWRSQNDFNKRLEEAIQKPKEKWMGIFSIFRK